MDTLKQLAHDARRALLLGEIDRFGELAHNAWVAKKKMSEGISNPALNSLYERARAAGAIGGKVSGAGGGGYMFFISRFNAKRDVVLALQAAGCQVVDFSFEHDGSRAWTLSQTGEVGRTSAVGAPTAWAQAGG